MRLAKSPVEGKPELTLRQCASSYADIALLDLDHQTLPNDVFNARSYDAVRRVIVGSADGAGD